MTWKSALNVSPRASYSDKVRKWLGRVGILDTDTRDRGYDDLWGGETAHQSDTFLSLPR